MTSTNEPKRDQPGYRGALPTRDDRLARPWIIVVIAIFVGDHRPQRLRDPVALRAGADAAADSVDPGHAVVRTDRVGVARPGAGAVRLGFSGVQCICLALGHAGTVADGR